MRRPTEYKGAEYKGAECGVRSVECNVRGATWRSGWSLDLA